MNLLPDKVDKLSQVFITETANCYDEHIAAEKEAKVDGETKLLSDKVDKVSQVFIMETSVMNT